AGKMGPSRFKESTHKKLDRQKGKDLVFVDLREQSTKETLHRVWIYNEPDLDNAPVLWAWYLSPEENQKVIDHYADRKIWYINPYKNATLIPYRKHKERK